jgi:hypothetical protein
MHFAKHGHKFGAIDASEYEKIADAFMFQGPMDDSRDCVRPNDGDRVRFGFLTHWEGIARRFPEPECIRSFYPVRPATIARRGGELAYFAFECGRTAGINL